MIRVVVAWTIARVLPICNLDPDVDMTTMSLHSEISKKKQPQQLR